MPGKARERKIFIGSDRMLHDSFRLARRVWEDGYIPDQIVAIWRGGTPVGIAIHEFFRYKGYEPQHTAIKCESYDGTEQSGKVEIKGLEHVIEMANSDDRMLVVDDVFDTGFTLQALVADIKGRARKNTPELRIATLYYKPLKNRTKLVPDYFVRKTNAWVVFPHELEGLTEEEMNKKGSRLCGILRS